MCAVLEGKNTWVMRKRKGLAKVKNPLPKWGGKKGGFKKGHESRVEHKKSGPTGVWSSNKHLPLRTATRKKRTANGKLKIIRKGEERKTKGFGTWPEQRVEGGQ